jgi:predicted CXXCH cytochrome family protein
MRQRNISGRSILLLILFLLAGGGAGLSADAQEASAENCTSTNCHAGIGKGKVVHPAVRGGCLSCHQTGTDPQKRTKHHGSVVVSLVQRGAELCSMCHEPKGKKKVVHAPITGGDCTSCHDPHQSPNKGMLRSAVPALCFQCHADSIANQAHMHPPVAAGECSSCHDNHESDYPGRLVQEGNALCFMCHPDKEEMLKSKKVVHYPVSASCVSCHNPHGSAHPAMLSAAVPELCATCHPNVVMQNRRTVTKHAPMNDRKSCRNCHEPHAANQPKLLVTAQMALCLACHNRVLETGNGKIENMLTFLQKNPNGHGPVKENDCVTCHSPHGSDHWRMLVRYYPKEFYASYSDGRYALCFSCHDVTAFTERLTTKTTGFRDGDRNLHFLHVKKLAKGRTCRACHEVHADNGRPFHVKETVQFSEWAMPIGFTTLPNGGSCAPGCHGEKRYSR